MIAAHVASSTGWSWAYIEEELDLPTLMALNKYWRSHPPTHLLMAAYVGFKPPVDLSTHVNDPAEVEAFIRMFGTQQPLPAFLKKPPMAPQFAANGANPGRDSHG